VIAPVKEVGTLAEIGAQVGDVVGCWNAAHKGAKFTIPPEGFETWSAKDKPWWRIIRRASDAKPQGPVITETVKRIVPGVYGSVSVSHVAKDAVEIAIKGPDYHAEMNAAELRAAIVTLTEIADALEGGAK
jgi:hypothetical protein